MKDWRRTLLRIDSVLQDAWRVIQKGEAGIALFVDDNRRLLRTITDGDIRRAMLAGQELDTPVSEFSADVADSPNPLPVTAAADATRADLMGLMKKHVVHQIPLLDDDERVVGLVTLDELLPDELQSLQAMIMAGGYGTRLRPLTEESPKSLLPIGDRPLMELVVDRLRQAGIRRVNIATHYLSEKIENHFGDGQEWGLDINYVTEERPLGTAGALRLLEKPKDPLLVVNGDILTGLDFRALFSFHRQHNADLTVAVCRHSFQVPYGVLECDGADVIQVNEKPVLTHMVNAGVYLLEPSVYQFLPTGKRFDMTNLIESLLVAGRSVVGFPVLEYWLDIGQYADYKQAQEDVQSGRFTV